MFETRITKFTTQLLLSTALCRYSLWLGIIVLNIFLSDTLTQASSPFKESGDNILECGIQGISVNLKRVDALAVEAWQELEQRSGNSTSTTIITVQTYVHILQSIDIASQRMLSDQDIGGYMDYLNAAFSASYFRFKLMGVSTTTNTEWATNGRDQKVAETFTSALKVGLAEVLNIYLVEALPDPSGKGLQWNGYTYYPVDAAGKTFDGIVLVRSWNGFRRHNTLVHEVGHWLGLYHTFEGGCDPSHPGDFVEDTPQHLNLASAVNCYSPVSAQDTCPLLPGTDPVRNYLTYSYDILCRDEFTPGQNERMLIQWKLYRRPLFTDSPSEFPSNEPTITPIPTTLPSAEPSQAPFVCVSWWRRCTSQEDCCSGKCHAFLWWNIFPSRCFLF